MERKRQLEAGSYNPHLYSDPTTRSDEASSASTAGVGAAAAASPPPPADLALPSLPAHDEVNASGTSAVASISASSVPARRRRAIALSPALAKALSFTDTAHGGGEDEQDRTGSAAAHAAGRSGSEADDMAASMPDPATPAHHLMRGLSSALDRLGSRAAAAAAAAATGRVSQPSSSHSTPQQATRATATTRADGARVAPHVHPPATPSTRVAFGRGVSSSSAVHVVPIVTPIKQQPLSPDLAIDAAVVMPAESVTVTVIDARRGAGGVAAHAPALAAATAAAMRQPPRPAAPAPSITAHPTTTATQSYAIVEEPAPAVAMPASSPSAPDTLHEAATPLPLSTALRNAITPFTSHPAPTAGAGSGTAMPAPMSPQLTDILARYEMRVRQLMSDVPSSSSTASIDTAVHGSLLAGFLAPVADLTPAAAVTPEPATIVDEAASAAPHAPSPPASFPAAAAAEEPQWQAVAPAAPLDCSRSLLHQSVVQRVSPPPTARPQSGIAGHSDAASATTSQRGRGTVRATPEDGRDTGSASGGIATLRAYLDRLRHNTPAAGDVWAARLPTTAPPLLDTSLSQVSAIRGAGDAMTVASAASASSRARFSTHPHSRAEAVAAAAPTLHSAAGAEAPLPSVSVFSTTAAVAATQLSEAPTAYAYLPSPAAAGSVVAGRDPFRTPQTTPPRDTMGRAISRLPPAAAPSPAAAMPVAESKLVWRAGGRALPSAPAVVAALAHGASSMRVTPQRPGLTTATAAADGAAAAPATSMLGTSALAEVSRDLFGAAAAQHAGIAEPTPLPRPWHGAATPTPPMWPISGDL